MDLVKRLFPGLCALALTACDGGMPGAPDVDHLHVHSADNEVTSLAVTTDGASLHVLWVETDEDDQVRAYHSRSEDGGQDWSAPVALDTGQAPPNRVQRSNDIRVAAHGETLLAVWQTRGDGFANSGPMVTARSEDGGRSWEAAVNPGQPGDSASQGFFDLQADPEGRFHLVWLDNRGGQQGLHHARSDDDGRTWSGVSTLDAATCQCCWNTMRHAGDGSWVLYRDLSPRDMALAASADGGDNWKATGTVGAFDWIVDGCPHVGGGLALTGDRPRLHALVWTGEEKALGLYYLEADGQDPVWSAPRRMGSRDARNSSLASHRDGQLIAAWDDGGADARVYLALRVDDRWSAESIVSDAGVRARHPLVLVTEHGAHVFWTQRSGDLPGTWAGARTRFPE